MGNLFELAEAELQRQGRADYTMVDIIDKAVKIRAWLDENRQGTAERILAGHNVYKYGNRFVTRIKFARVKVFRGYNTI